jgi:tetratricopeptide (TPR) repeat protein
VVRSRPPVGRRLWRRRRRRPDDAGPSSAPAKSGDVAAGDDFHDAGDEREEEEEEEEEADGNSDGDEAGGDSDSDGEDGRSDAARRPVGTTTTKPPGFFARLFGRKPEVVPPVVVVDPTREILALPRGVARLDAFEKKLQALDVGGGDHRRVALAFHKELTGLADDAGVDLQLYEARVTACANALIAAGEDEKAGALFARLGRRHQAAELFVRAGAIDALEEQHEALAFDEGGARLDARLSFERFEALFLVGLRDDALAALERACALWDNPIYGEVLAGFRARIPAGGTLTLVAGDDVVSVVDRFPIVIGRGEECAVRLDSPLVSRAHVEVAAAGGDLVARAVVGVAASTVVDGQPLSSPTLLSTRGTLQLSGVVLDYEATEQRLLVRPRLQARRVTLVARGDVVDDAVVGARITVRGGRFRLAVDGRARLNGDVVRRDALLLVDDRVALGGRTWTIARR